MFDEKTLTVHKMIIHSIRRRANRMLWAQESLASDIEVQKSFPKIIQQESQKIVELTNKLQGLGETLDNIVEEINFSELLAKIVDEHLEDANMRNIQLSYEIADGVFLTGDSLAIELAIESLIDNALKYTSAGGKIFVKSSQPADLSIVEINDTGIGIPADELPRIFESNYRASNARDFATGSGLGMKLAQSIINNMNGDINVTSTLGKGTNILVTFRRE